MGFGVVRAEKTDPDAKTCSKDSVAIPIVYRLRLIREARDGCCGRRNLSRAYPSAKLDRRPERQEKSSQKNSLRDTIVPRLCSGSIVSIIK